MADFPYPDTCLIIFARAPIPGMCKTRLVPELGEQGAADLQRELIGRCIQQLCTDPICATQLWCAPDSGHVYFQSLAKQYDVSLHTQQGKDLGEKMYHAMSSSPALNTIIVGTDIPLLSRTYVEHAIGVLRAGMDAVIGPAEDGGYVLLGLQQIEQGLFTGIDWGTSGVARQTMDKMTASGLRWRTLDEQWDLDNTGDLERYRQLKSAELTVKFRNF
jgi:rSAM/selenodomain-associated transferase 1